MKKLKCLNKADFCANEKNGFCRSKDACEWREKRTFDPPATMRTPRPAKACTCEHVEIICERVAKGETLRKILQDPSLPSAPTFFAWLQKEENAEWAKQYARSIEARALLSVDELRELDEKCIDAVMRESEDSKRANAIVGSYKNLTDNIKWTASKMLPKVYGNTSDGPAASNTTYNVVVLSSDSAIGDEIARAAARKIDVGVS